MFIYSNKLKHSTKMDYYNIAIIIVMYVEFTRYDH